jgi:hypothetical protein
VTGLQTAVLALGTAAVALSSAVIVWRELGGGGEARFMRSWRDYFGLALTLAGVAALVWWLWAST